MCNTNMNKCDLYFILFIIILFYHQLICNNNKYDLFLYYNNFTIILYIIYLIL